MRARLPSRPANFSIFLLCGKSERGSAELVASTLGGWLRRVINKSEQGCFMTLGGECVCGGGDGGIYFTRNSSHIA